MRKGNISNISIFVSIVALAFSIIRCKPITVDWMAVLVGILSALTTTLIGWQILTIIKIEKIRKETLLAKNEVINETNINLLHTLHGLADFFAIRFNDICEDVEVKEKEVFYYAAVLYRSMEIELSSKLNQISMFSSSIKALYLMIDDIDYLTKEQKEEILKILSIIPPNKITSELYQITNKLK